MSFHIAEHLFALDLIDLVMKRRFEESQIQDQSLPFTPEIRSFVCSFLDREEMKINRIFSRVQGNQVYKNGAVLAPSIALEEISDFVKKYISAGFQSENTIWLKLGMESQLSIEQPTTSFTEEETADIQSVKRDKLQELYNHIKKQTKKAVTV
ncbi:hypothetical protein TNIN_172541 [Trichonephila inaurata madagascariensis]|uniref:Uncharacterized protein n=1 Tax=Trichonephila inaurata madagascariensis TaxID=2747483 RepID=A0A8X6XHD2_9ARAC|nr:hypothetical protein TNIN_172541 [Trichonephila inaurata madagascariensis]